MIELLGLAGLLMLLGCFVPAHRLPVGLPHESLLHIGAFALLTLPLCTFDLTRLEIAGAGLGIWLLGLLIECLQNLVPGRHFGVDDLVYNAIGIALVAVPCALLGA